MAVTQIASGTSTSSSTTVTATYSGSTLSTGFLVVCLALNLNNPGTATCDDDAGSSNTYTLDDSTTGSASNGVAILSAPIVDAIDNGTVFTVTIGTATNRKLLLVYHVDDLEAAPFLENGRANATTQTPSATLDGAPGVATTLTISATCVNSDGALAWTAGGTGGTALDTSNRSLGTSYRYRTTNAAHNEGGSYTDTSAITATVVCCYEQTAGTEYTDNPTGTLTSAGSLLKEPAQVKGGTLTTAGVLTKAVAHFKSGVLDLAGALNNSYVPGGGPTEYTQSLDGTITSAGAVKKDVSHFKGGTLTTAGSLVRATEKFPSGAITLAGSLVKSVNKFLAGVLTLAGQGDFVPAGPPTEFTQSLAGTLTTSGSLTSVIVSPPVAVAPFLHRDVRGGPFHRQMVYPMGRGRR